MKFDCFFTFVQKLVSVYNDKHLSPDHLKQQLKNYEFNASTTAAYDKFVYTSMYESYSQYFFN